MFPKVDIVVSVVDFKPSKEIDFEVLEDGHLIPFLNVKLLERNKVKRVEIVILMNMTKDMDEYLPSLKNSILYLSKFFRYQNVDAVYHLFLCNGGCKRYDYTDGNIRLPDQSGIRMRHLTSNYSSKKRAVSVKNPKDPNSRPYLTKPARHPIDLPIAGRLKMKSWFHMDWIFLR